MTPNQSKIIIQNPCSEKWDAMQLDTIGRFCQSCQKSVIDFTSQTDEEIKHFLKDKQGEKLCGRFYLQQLDRIRIEIDQNILVSNIPFWQKFLVVLLVCFGSDFLGIDFAFSQTDSVPSKTEQVDSLVGLAIGEPDSLPLTPADSVCSSKTHSKPEKNNWITQITVMGDFYYPIHFAPSSPNLFPKLEINSEKREPEEIPKNILVKNPKPEVPSYEMVQALKHLPIVPKHPKKEPVHPTENAIIADTGERRKTRRS